ncbi:secA2 [Symbiodinium sp. CCMP2592]|nr:secA2 [Symbiodinium sp. CCMP2592]
MSNEYSQFKKHFGSKWQAFAYLQVSRMCMQRQEVHETPYEFDGHRVGYVKNDTVNWDVSYGYVTMFHYLQEWEDGRLQEPVLESKLKLQVSCGRFAYSEVELPKVMLGVSGTVDDLTANQREILKQIYGIGPQQHSVMPSVFGESNLRFLDCLQQFNPLLICNESDHALEIAKAIDEQLDNGRSVLVFFESDAALEAFASSSHFQGLSCSCKTQQLVASAPAKERKRIVFNAATWNHVTLCSAAFGRGTDFISRDPHLLENGGVHVIQTFFSRDKSEETQIMGRTARQGQKGSYSMILSKEHLQKIGVQQIPQGTPAELYKKLCDFREQHDEAWKLEIEAKLQESRKDHDETSAYVDRAKTGCLQTISDGFNDYTLRQTSPTGCSKCRVILVVDATLSMGKLWHSASRAIMTAVKRIREWGGIYEFKWIAYRDYCDEKLIEQSTWTSDEKVLQQFIDRIECEGGGGNSGEAVEEGLKAARLEHEKETVAAIVHVGDEPARDAIEEDPSFKHPMQTTYHEEADKLSDCGIAVYSYRVGWLESTKLTCQTLADKTGGTFGDLGVDDDSLIHAICTRSFMAAGDMKALAEYRVRYENEQD